MAESTATVSSFRAAAFSTAVTMSSVAAQFAVRVTFITVAPLVDIFVDPPAPPVAKRVEPIYNAAPPASCTITAAAATTAITIARQALLIRYLRRRPRQLDTRFRRLPWHIGARLRRRPRRLDARFRR